jgi:hypothetical protein
MTTFQILWKCLPFFLFVAIGVYLLFVAFIPSWREPGWRHWKVFSGEDNSRSLLVQLGFVKPNKPIKEGDFSEKTAVRLLIAVGSLFLLLGAAGIGWIAYLNPGD